ncbi:hypothetical protein EJB05_38429, partial [Eragrostis curvula]
MAVDKLESVAVVAVPFPAQGHLNQLLHLSLQLASRGLSVHYAAPGPHVRQARDRVHGWDPKALSTIAFHDLEVPAYESPPPDPAAPSPFPSHLMPMIETFHGAARAPLARILQRLSATHRRVVVVFDRLNSFAATEAARLGNGEAFGLQCVAMSYDLGWLDPGHRLLRDHGLREVVPAEDIQKVIEEAMLPDSGTAVRQRAKELGEAVRASVAGGGTSRKDFDDFVGYITR